MGTGYEYVCNLDHDKVVQMEDEAELEEHCYVGRKKAHTATMIYRK